MLQQTKKISIILTSITVFFSTVIVPHALAEEIVISGNGNESNNQVTTSSSNQTNVQSNNTATINNNITATANTGNNSTSNNTGGDSTINTGNATVTTDVTTTANTAVVDSTCCTTAQSQIQLTNNGANSQNTVNHDTATQITVTANNNATVTNTVSTQVNTGGNTANNNSGDVTIKTGNITAKTSVINDPVNKTKIFVAESPRDILTKIVGNGAFSINSINKTAKNNSDINVLNFANILNNIQVVLNTGDNHADKNKGDVTIVTGDIVSEIAISNTVNATDVSVSCCKEKEKDKPEKPGDNPNPSVPGPSSSTSSSGGGSSSGSSNDTGAVLGAMLPVTGNYLLLLGLIGNILLLIFGAYLRLHSGNSPGVAFAI